MSVLLTFTLAGVATFFLRSCMNLFGRRLQSSPVIERSIALVSPAVLAAIVASAIFIDQGALAPPDLVSSLAIVTAAVAVHRTDNVSMALFVGLPVYWVGAATGLA